MTPIDTPGVYDLPELEYHADPVAQAPSLSRSIAKVLIEASPLHAYVQHPRLGGKRPTALAKGDDSMDVGSAAHAAFLEGNDSLIKHIPVDAYRSDAAKAARDLALAEGLIPLKTAQYDAAMRVVERLRVFQRATGRFTNGKGEQTLIWDEGDLWCRARVDWLPDGPAAPLIDLKTTGSLASVPAWSRSCFQFGADIQAAMYPRGVEYIRGEPPDGMLFVVIETNPPYGIRVFSLDPIAIEVGQAKLQAARALWVQCMHAGEWPSYPPDVEWIMPPPWVVREWEENRAGGFGRAREDTQLIERMMRQGNWGG